MITTKYLLIISYDGSSFHGSQLQNDLRTIQGDLETVIEKVFGVFSRVSLSSRTDSGVHAEFQVGTFDLKENKLDSFSVRSAMNSYLEEDIRIMDVGVLTSDAVFFDPRRDAISREYVYIFNDSQVLHPKFRDYVYHVKGKLNEHIMNKGASLLLGKHDFIAFAGHSTSIEDYTVREVFQSTVTRTENFVRFSITSNGFLHQQIRRISGLLLQIGLGKKSPDIIRYYLDSKVRGEFTNVLSPKGLSLKNIKYKDNFLQKFLTN